MLLVGLSLLCGPLLSARHAAGHPNHGPSWGERYLKLDATAAGVRVIYGVTVSARFGQQLRTAADHDRDGIVDEAEVEAFGRSYIEQLSKNVTVKVDDSAREEVWVTPFIVGLGGQSARGPIAVETSASLSVPPGVHEVTIDDRAEFEGIYRTTAKILAAPEVAILKAGKGAAPRARELRLVFLDLPEDGPPPPRLITVELSVPGRSGLGVPTWSLWAASGCLVALLTTVAVVLWRRRRRLTGPGTDSGL